MKINVKRLRMLIKEALLSEDKFDDAFGELDDEMGSYDDDNKKAASKEKKPQSSSSKSSAQSVKNKASAAFDDAFKEMDSFDKSFKAEKQFASKSDLTVANINKVRAEVNAARAKETDPAKKASAELEVNFSYGIGKMKEDGGNTVIEFSLKDGSTALIAYPTNKLTAIK